MKRPHTKFHILLIIAVLLIITLLAEMIIFFVLCMQGYTWPTSLLGIIDAGILTLFFIAILVLLFVIKPKD